ncbi:hypothetical protein EV714DRAFT_210998 [Schizophyllum commune]
MQPPNSRASHVKSHPGSTATCHFRLRSWPCSTPRSGPLKRNSNDLTRPPSEALFVYRPPPKETLFDIIDRTWSQLEQEFESCRRGFDRSPVTQDNRPGEGGHRLGYVQQLPRHAPLHPVSAISQLDDIFPLCHEQCIPTTVQPEHLQFDLVPARTPEHASSTTHNIPFRLEARLPSSDTDTLAPWDTQYAVLDALNADMYYESLQAPRYGEHSAGRPTQRAIEFARQPEPGVCFGDTLDHPADVAAASVRSDNPFAHSTWSMPLKAESSFDEFSTQSPPSPSPYPP